MKMAAAKLADHESIDDDHMAWLASLPAAVVVTECHGGARRIVTHAGLLPDWGLRQPTKALIRNRYIKRVGVSDRWNPEKFGPGFTQPPGTVLWDEVYADAPRVIYGHIVHGEESPRILNNCYGIDTGCCFGGRLTAYVEDLATGEVTFMQEQADRVYFARGVADDG